MRYKEITEVKKNVAAWYAGNELVYYDFRDMVDDALLNGDMHLLEEIFGMLKSFVPKDVAQEAESAIASLDREMEGPKDNDSESQGDMIDVLEDLIKQEYFADECKKMVSEIKPEIEAVEGEIAEKIRKKDDKVFCYYYWMLFDNGPTETITIFSNYLKKKKVNYVWRWIFKQIFKIIVKQSFLFDVRKTDWQKYAKRTNSEETRELVLVALDKAKTTGGKRIDCRKLDALVTNPELVCAIGKSLVGRESDVEIAYILMNLVQNGLIEDVAYTTFHNALKNEFPEEEIKGHGKAQFVYCQLRRLYNMKNDVPCYLSPSKMGSAKEKVKRYNAFFLPFKVK